MIRSPMTVSIWLEEHNGHTLDFFRPGGNVGNQMVSVSDITTSGLQMQGTYVYDALGQRIGKDIYSAGTTTTTRFAYDERQIWTDLNGSNVLQLRYLRTDRVLELLARVPESGTVTWLLQDRMDSVGTYGYDLNGNRNTSGYSTGLANEMMTDGTWNYFYDKNGNLSQKINIASGEVFAFGYDNRNQMVSVTDTTTSGLQMQSTYSYDALQQRIEKAVWTEGTTTTPRFAYDQRQIWADLDGTNALTMRYMRTDNVLELLTRVSAGGTVAWLLQDRLGSVRNVVDGAGAVLATLAYTGFGNTVGGSGAGNSGVYLWVGYRYDQETGLFLADGSLRFYDSVTGRWWKFDPIGIEGEDSNLLRYVRNNPTNAIDPLGTHPVVFVGAGVLGVFLACAIPVYRGVLQDAAKNNWVNDKFLHCLASCRVARRCGGAISQLTGLAKETIDEIIQLFTGQGEGFDTKDWLANQDGIMCAGEEASNIPFFIGGWIASLYRESCARCCQKDHDPSKGLREKKKGKLGELEQERDRCNVNARTMERFLRASPAAYPEPRKPLPLDEVRPADIDTMKKRKQYWEKKASDLEKEIENLK